MVVLDEKIPPPPYAPSGPAPPSSPSSQIQLPSHLLLKIVYMTMPGWDQSRTERQRKTLYWLSQQLRMVDRSFYIACMHVLRSTYLPAYGSLVRAPYTSDPFPLSSSTAGPVETIQRETQVLDLFIALKVREDVMMDDTELHLEREESFRDLFDLMQPRSRLEDLVRYYGLREGVVHASTPGVSFSPTGLYSNGGSSSPSSHRTSPTPLPFSTLSVSFSPRKAGLVVTTTTRRRTIVEVARTRDEKLEVTAKQLVKRLRAWLNDT